MATLPDSMRAVRLRAYDGKAESLVVGRIPVPRPGPGQVLVRVAASPVNPSDIAFVHGVYGFKKPLPAIPGFEGSGTVVESGGGVMARWLKGRRVACYTADPNIPGGMWAEFAVTSAKACVPLRKDVELEQAATMLVNPMTAWGMMAEARRGGHRAVVQTVAASALGRMVIRLGKKFGIPTINVVRRAEQVRLLRDMGAEHVLDSSDPGFDKNLRELCHRLSATIGFDAVAGEMSGRVLRAQPRGAGLLVYGALSLQAAQADAGSLIFEQKHLEGFLITAWVRKRNMLGQLRIARQVQKLLASDLRTEIRARYPLEEVTRALQEYAANMTGGKILLIA